jgi:hypothetical protein
MVKRLDRVEKVQYEGEPLTYYVGQLSIPGEDRPYTVVVTQLIEMGNPDAAITTTKVIPRWHPRNVLMVGIAGGVKEKAALGDVVVSQYAHYYPPAKRKPKEVEHRRSGLRSGGGCRWRRPPAIRQPVTQDLGRRLRVVGQTLQKITRVGEGIDAVPVTRRCDTEQGRRRLGAARAAGEQPILAAHGNVQRDLLGPS